jgi:carbon starvation protein CstA
MRIIKLSLYPLVYVICWVFPTLYDLHYSLYPSASISGIVVYGAMIMPSLQGVASGICYFAMNYNFIYGIDISRRTLVLQQLDKEENDNKQNNNNTNNNDKYKMTTRKPQIIISKAIQVSPSLDKCMIYE